jgi:hypothetical protein
MTGDMAAEPGAAVASVLLRDLLAGPVRPAAVIAAGPAATYAEVGGRVLALVGPGGVRLPCALVLAGPARLPAAGSRLSVGAGAVHQDGRAVIAVRRWFDPRVRLARVDHRALGRLGRVVRSRGTVDVLLPGDAVDRLATGLGRGDARGAVTSLLGRGSGLTPAGDDLLAGTLASLRALDSPAADDLGTAVRALAPRRTTRLSAALLEAADVGAVIPEAAGVLRALTGIGEVETAAGRLVDVGHTSGWHLAAGLLVGVTHAMAGARVGGHVAPRRAS